MLIIGIITCVFNEIARLVCAKFVALVDGFNATPGCSRRWDCVSGSAFLKKSVPGWGTLQSKCISLGKGDCDFVAGLSDDAVEGLAGDAHACGGIDPVEVFGVREPQGLDLLREQHGFLQVAQGDACGFEIVAGRLMGDMSRAGGAGHRMGLLEVHHEGCIKGMKNQAKRD